MAKKNGVLFLCVANSSRSQMAEGLAREMAPGEIEIFSAGSNPTSLNPAAIDVMKEIGIDIAKQHSKSIQEIPQERIGTVITLCAEEVCPAFPADVQKQHWPFDDPAAAPGTQEDVLAAFRQVRDQIHETLEQYFKHEPV
ncbi:MAG: arsenate reductase ArsC [Myxococcota bacterium]|jgi:arsenate reductase|nr:arsenate reductase ArsC [Myxococcota bacterium]